MPVVLRAGLLLHAPANCPHCSRPTAGAADSCHCGVVAWGERRGPGHGLAGVLA